MRTVWALALGLCLSTAISGCGGSSVSSERAASSNQVGGPSVVASSTIVLGRLDQGAQSPPSIGAIQLTIDAPGVVVVSPIDPSLGLEASLINITATQSKVFIYGPAGTGIRPGELIRVGFSDVTGPSRLVMSVDAAADDTSLAAYDGVIARSMLEIQKRN